MKVFISLRETKTFAIKNCPEKFNNSTSSICTGVYVSATGDLHTIP